MYRTRHGSREVWRSVAWVKACSIFRWNGDGEARSLLEGVVAALIARCVAPEEILILGSGGGGTPIPFFLEKG